MKLLNKTTIAVRLALLVVIVALHSCGDNETTDSIPNEPNTPPIANAGNSTNALVGSVVRLDGSKSYDKDKNIISYEWSFQSRPDGSSVKLSKTNTSHPKFTPDVEGSYIIELIVRDDESSSSPSTVTVVAAVGNAAPNVDAGEDISVIAGDEVTLDGSGSTDPNNDPLTFSWTLTESPEGASVSLSDPNTSHPKFTPSVAGDYVFSLVVSDGSLSSPSENVTVDVTELNSNASPVANAGMDLSVHTGDKVDLYGGESYDPDGDVFTYSWHFVTSPEGSLVSLVDEESSQPSFIPDVDGEYVIALVINDGSEDSEPSMVTVTATTFSFKEQLINYGIEGDDADYLLANHFNDVMVFLNDSDKIFKNMPSLNIMFGIPSDPDAAVFNDPEMTFWSVTNRNQFNKMFGRFVFVVNSPRFIEAFNNNIGLLDDAYQGNPPSIPYPDNYLEFRRDANKAMEEGHYQFKFYISNRRSFVAWGVQGLKLKVETVMFGPPTPGAVHNTAALILHELTHSWGYAHAGLGIPSGIPPVNNIPYYVQGLVGGSYINPGAALVYDTPEALLTIYFGNN